MNLPTQQRQDGIALAVSLILLLSLTILGVATLTSTRFQEKITSNSQQKAVAFEAAETAINTVNTDVSLILDSIISGPAGQYNDPDPVFPTGIADQLSVTLDQQNGRGVSVDITSAVSIQYCGENAQQVGTELSGDKSKVRLVAVLFDVNGTAQIANTNAKSDHVERSSMIRPETERTGACITPAI